MLMSARNTVKFKLDPKSAKSLTAAQRKRLTAVTAMPDSAIDYSDIPRQAQAIQWTRPGALVSSETVSKIRKRYR
jgi:hypothetical protein